MAATAILNFGKMSITPDWIKISCIKLYGKMHHMNKNRNRKLICVMSSNKGRKHMCVNLSDYNRYLNQIWYIAQVPYYQHAGMAKFT